MPSDEERAELFSQLNALNLHMARTTGDHMLALDVATKFVLRSLVDEVERLAPGFAQRLTGKLDMLAEMTEDREQADAFTSACAALTIQREAVSASISMREHTWRSMDSSTVSG